MTVLAGGRSLVPLPHGRRDGCFASASERLCRPGRFSLPCSIALVGIAVLSLSILSCAGSKQIAGLQARVQEASLLAIQVDRNQKRLEQEVQSLGRRLDKIDKLLRSDKAGKAEDLRQIAQQLEELMVSLQDLSERQESLRSAVLDLEEAVRHLLKRKGRSSKAKAKSPRELFAAARRDFNRGNYNAAQKGFKNFLAAYPNTSLSDDAQFWLAESLAAASKYVRAIAEFKRLVERYPRSDRQAEALLRLGACYKVLGRVNDARRTWATLLKRFPDSNEARVARSRLSSLGSQPRPEPKAH